MATLVLGAIGAAIGSEFASAGLGWSIGTIVGGLIMNLTNKPTYGRIYDLSVSGSSYGTFIPQAWGEVRIGGQIIWAEPLKEHSPGGSGMNSSSYSYTVTMAVLICKGQIDHIERIYGEDLVIYDATQTPTTKYNISIYDGSETQTQDPTMQAALAAAGLPCPAHRGYAYVVFNNFDLTNWSSRIPNLNFDVVMQRNTTGEVVTDVLEQVGLSSGDIDVTQATQTIDGYIVADRRSASDNLTPLLTAMNADLAEVDGQIVYVPRGANVIATISSGDLAAVKWSKGQDVTPTILVKRKQDRELPISVEVTYFSTLSYLQSGTQRALRYTKNFNQDPQTLQLPMSLDDTTARQIAERILYTTWVERLTCVVNTSIKWLWLSIGDILLVTVAGQQIRFRVDDIEHEPFGQIQFTLTQDDNLVLNQVVQGATNIPIDSTFLSSTAASGVAWNGPALTDADATTVGIYYCGAGQVGWGGGTVYISTDGGLSYKKKGAITSYSLIGNTLSALPSFSSTAVFDNTNFVDVQLVRGSPAGVGYWDIINGSNAALIGGEYIQFENVTILNPTLNQYRLSGLLRGQRGSDAFWATHAIGDAVAILDSTLQKIILDNSVIGSTVTLKIVGGGLILSGATPISVLVAGYEFFPYSPCYITGTRDISQNLTITWLRRTRIGGEWADLMDVPLSEATESYSVDIMNGSSVVRTINNTSPTVSYTAAQQVTDFGSPQSALQINVYQIGQLGRGFPGNKII